jgi:hypothetical protein
VPSKQFPPEVRPAATVGDEIDLLDAVLADVADPHVAVGAVEGEPPRVAQAVVPDLVAAGAADEWVRPRHRVASPRGRAAWIDAQDLSEQAVEVLPAAQGIAAAAVAGRHVEAPGAVLELTAVVIAVGRVLDLEHSAAAAAHG